VKHLIIKDAYYLYKEDIFVKRLITTILMIKQVCTKLATDLILDEGEIRNNLKQSSWGHSFV